ncbi:hypothetical protein [Gloeobacter morelensis]|uniref:Transposase n=1 Tax=Gloeobacter morelensis MG652769 TaxID=2781736 RepID=A0ABY3PRJ7_9CYAN|nr:hypothetical protein [Gloeobacter morelensis]UFP96229.1 hypothetical protein ISF26_08490 [Gloeobacter morelensis MG652769]
MARAKLSHQEKQDIARLYRETHTSTTRLAEQFGVSVSTISRLLKSELGEQEYTGLSAMRRAARGPSEASAPAEVVQEELPAVPPAALPEEPSIPPQPMVVVDGELADGVDLETPASTVLPKPQELESIAELPPQAVEPEPIAASQALEEPVPAPVFEISDTSETVPVSEVSDEVEPAPTFEVPGAVESAPTAEPPRRRRRRAAAVSAEPEPVPESPPIVAPAPEPPVEVVLPAIAEFEPAAPEVLPPPARPEGESADPPPVRSRILKRSDPARMAASEPAAAVPSQFAELEAEFAQSAGRFAGEEFDEEDDFDEEEDEDGLPLEPETLSAESSLPIEVLPFAEAEFPRTCWVVVDRASELMTRPLRDFNIGTIPDGEREEITLPIFENQRVARRYSSHYHRPLRLPAHLILSTRLYLLRKGITRLLVGKQVYSLVQGEEVPVNGDDQYHPDTEDLL